MRVRRKKAEADDGNGYCAICKRATSNGFCLKSKYGTSVMLICPNCLVNSDAPEAKEARSILGVRR